MAGYTRAYRISVNRPWARVCFTVVGVERHMKISENAEKLPILHIVLNVIKELKERKGVLFQRLVILALIMTAFESLTDFFIAEANFRVLIVYWLIYGMVFTLFAVTCHRVIILGPDSVPKYGLYSISMREVRFYGWGLVVYFYLSLITFIIMFPTVFFSFYSESNKYLWVSGMYILFIPGTYVFSRLSILFPATAVDQRKDMKWAWDTTKGNGWRLLILIGVLPVIIDIVPDLFSGGSVPIDTALNFLKSMVAAFEIALLSHAYKYLSTDGIKEEGLFSA